MKRLEELRKLAEEKNKEKQLRINELERIIEHARWNKELVKIAYFQMELDKLNGIGV